MLTTQELLTEDHMTSIQAWPALAGAVPINRLLLPQKLESFDDLRLPAAQIQADVLLVYTLDTSFRIQGRGYGPLAAISLGVLPDRDAYITSTASALFIDVRTGFVYGVAESTAKTSGLTNIWSSSSTIDKKRVEAEQQAFDQLMSQAAITWKESPPSSNPWPDRSARSDPLRPRHLRKSASCASSARVKAGRDVQRFRYATRRGSSCEVFSWKRSTVVIIRSPAVKRIAIQERLVADASSPTHPASCS